MNVKNWKKTSAIYSEKLIVKHMLKIIKVLIKEHMLIKNVIKWTYEYNNNKSS